MCTRDTEHETHMILSILCKAYTHTVEHDTKCNVYIYIYIWHRQVCQNDIIHNIICIILYASVCNGNLLCIISDTLSCMNI